MTENIIKFKQLMMSCAATHYGKDYIATVTRQ